MVIYDSDRLQVSVNYRGASKTKTPFFHIFADGVAQGSGRWYLIYGLPAVYYDLSFRKAPNIIVKTAEFSPYLQNTLGIVYDGAYLQPIADDPCILHQFIEFRFIVTGDSFDMEVVKRFFKIFLFV